MLVRHGCSSVGAATTQSSVAYSILSGLGNLPGWTRLHERADAHGYMAIGLKAYDRADNRVNRGHLYQSFDNGNSAYVPGVKKKARNCFRARERWSCHRSIGTKRDGAELCKQVNHQRGRTNETARYAGVLSETELHYHPARTEIISPSLRAAYAATRLHEQLRPSLLVINRQARRM